MRSKREKHHIGKISLTGKRMAKVETVGKRQNSWHLRLGIKSYDIKCFVRYNHDVGGELSVKPVDLV